MKFNPTKPNNLLSKLPMDVNLHDSEILIALNKANQAISELKIMTSSLPNPQVILDFLSFRESIDSNAIEQINTTMIDVLLSEKEAIEKRSQADKETIHYKDALIYGYNVIKKNKSLTLKDLVKINEIIIENKQGIISSPNKRIEKTFGSKTEISYTPPQGLKLIKDLCANLIDYVNVFDEESEIDPLLKIPLMHYQFEAIHPFGDGNGRVGRILMVLALVLHKKLEYPILFLSEYINKHKKEYYQKLQDVDKFGNNKVKELIIYMLYAIGTQSLTTHTLILKIKIQMLQTKNKIKGNKILYNKDVIDYLYRDPIYSRKTYAKYMNKSLHTASKHLKKLEGMGICRSMRHKNSIYYINHDYYNLIIGKN